MRERSHIPSSVPSEPCGRTGARPGCIAVVTAMFCVALGHMCVAPAEQLPVRVYTIADGLSQDAISDIEWDPRGFLWFCTTDGLSRFDGYEFTNYGREDGLAGNLVTDLLITRSGQYWVAASPGGFFRIEDSSSGPFFVPVRAGELPTVYKLFETRSGAILFGTDRGLFRLGRVGEQWQAHPVDLGAPRGTSLLEVVEMVEDASGAMWIGSSQGLYRRDEAGRATRFGVTDGLPSDLITALLSDREDSLWAGTALGLCELIHDAATNRVKIKRVFTTSDGLPTNAVDVLLRTSGGRLWAGTNQGLAEFLPEEGMFRGYARRDGLSDLIIRDLAEDPDGNLWVGTESGGAVRIARRGFTTYREEDGLGSGRIASIFQTRTGRLCVVDSWLRLHDFAQRSFTSVRPNIPAKVTYLGWGWYQRVLQDHTGEWWIPTGEGLCRFSATDRIEDLSRLRPKAFYTRRDGLGGDDIFRLYEDTRGDIWMGSISPGGEVLTRWDRATGSFHRYDIDDGIPHAAPSAFCDIPGGDLWIGFYTGGIARFRGDRFTYFSIEDGVPEGFIEALFLDSDGRLWIASARGGLARIDNPIAGRPRFTIYAKAQGLSSDHVKAVTEDRWGQIYVGTVRGLDRLDPDTGRIRHYTTTEGLANNYVNVAFCDREGAIWVGTLQGLSRLIPEPESESPRVPPPVLITGLRIGGIRYPVSRFGQTDVPGIEVESRDVQIEFLGLSYAAGEVLRYQYWLEGADAGWSLPREERSVNYAHISPGSYRFVVRALGSDDRVSPRSATVTFAILPPLWRRWWFLLIAVIAVGAVTYAAYSYRVARLLELLRVRTRLSRDLHDDVGASLSRIAILSEIARKQIGDVHQEAVEPLTTIAESAREVVDSMSDVVWATDPTQDDLASLVHRIRKFASDLLETQSIRVEMQAPADIDRVRLGPEQRRQVYLVFKEALNNVARHSGCSSVLVTFRIGGGKLEGEIADDGRGFEAGAPARVGHGLTSMRSRAGQMGGSLKIETTPGHGARVLFSVPLKQHEHAPFSSRRER